MVFSIRKILKRGAGKKNAKAQARRQSPSMSMASLSTSSSNSSPPTPTALGPVIRESRGIFRTLEPVWYYHRSVLGNALTGINNGGDDDDAWIPFDAHCQNTLEVAFNQNRAFCQLGSSSLGPSVTIAFVPEASERPTTTRTCQRRPVTMMVPSSQANNPMTPSPSPTLILNKAVRRVVAHAWWYEQDSPDGTKGMCRFDYKNQARLEALSDDEERSKFTLTDQSFPYPFTVVLDTTKSRQQKEEWRGFMHLDIPVMPHYTTSPQPYLVTDEPTYNQASMNSYYYYFSNKEVADDEWPMEPIIRRFSI